MSREDGAKTDSFESSNDQKVKEEEEEKEKEERELHGCLERNVVPAEIMFFLFKVAEGILEPSVRLYLYDSVCLNAFQYSASHPYNDICSNLSSDPAKEDIVQDASAKYMATYKLLLNLPAMLMVLCCGVWSDRGGRTTPIIFTCLGTVVACVTFMVSSLRLLWEVPNMVVLLLGAGIRGAFGRSAIMTMAVNSYVSDHSVVGKRTRRLSNLIAISNFGYLLGSSFSGYLLELCDSSFVFMIVTILNTVCVLIAYFFMPDRNDEVLSECPRDDGNSVSVIVDEAESSPLINDSRQRYCAGPIHQTSSDSPSPPAPEEVAPAVDTSNASLDSSSASNQSSSDQTLDSEAARYSDQKPRLCDHSRHFVECLCLLVKKRPARRRYAMWGLLAVLYLHQMNKSGEGDIYLLFVRRHPLSVSKSSYGYLVSATYASLGLFAFSVPKFIEAFDLQVEDSTLAMAGIVCKIGSLILLSFSQSVWMLGAAAMLTGVISLTVSSVRSLVSKIVDSGELGKAFSIIASGETLCNLIGSLVYTSVYTRTAHVHPGIGFLLEAGVYTVLVGALVHISLQPLHPRKAIET